MQNKLDFLPFLKGLDSTSDDYSSLCPFVSPAWANFCIENTVPSEQYGVLSRDRKPFEVWLTVGPRSSRLRKNFQSIGLNEPSSTELASITTEYNNLIGSEDFEALAEHMDEIFDALAQRHDWHELRLCALNLSQKNSAIASALRKGWLWHIHDERTTYSTQLQLAGPGPIEQLFSSNTRQQLRRNKRKLELRHSDLTLETTRNCEIAQSWLDELAILHQLKWNSNGETSGFANPSFARFQQSLLSTWLPQGKLDLVKLSCSGRTVAILHFMTNSSTVFFNMSGINYLEFGDFKPGLLGHWIAMQHFKEKGVQTYDFMGGTNQYKQSLSTKSHEQFGLLIRRPSLRFLAEHHLRNFKRSRTSKKINAS